MPLYMFVSLQKIITIDYSLLKKTLLRHFAGFLTPFRTRCPCTVDYNSSCDTGQGGFPAAPAAAS